MVGERGGAPSDDGPPDGGETAHGPCADGRPPRAAGARPPRLRFLLETVGACPQATAVLCGPERVLLYNDAFARGLGDRHPDVHGRPLHEAFPETAEALAAPLARAFAGEGAAIAPADGGEADVFLTPVRNEEGHVAQVLVAGPGAAARFLAPCDRGTPPRRDLERRVAEATAELKASRDLLQATMDGSMDMIQVFEAVRDAAGRIVDFRWILNNHTSERLYGEVRGESLLARNPGVVVEGIFDSFRRVAETGVPEQAEHHYAHEQFDGWFLQSVVKLNDGVATSTKDVTAWKQAQAEILRLQEAAAAASLRESEELRRIALEGGRMGAWRWDPRRRLVSADAQFLAFFGLPPSDAPLPVEILVERLSPRGIDALEGMATEAIRNGGDIDLQLEIMAGPAAGRWIQCRGRADAAFSFLHGVAFDVTEPRRVEAALRENRRRLTTVVEGIPQLVWRAAEGGRFTWASPQWSRTTGLTLAQSLGTGWMAALHPGDRDRVAGAWAQADGSAPLDMDSRLFHQGEQRYRWFQSRAVPVRDDEGRVLEWIGASTDVDDLRQLQERQQVLVAELQHRTRNLLGVVRSMADRTAAGASTLEEFLPRYRTRLAALSRINGLLSRLEKGERVTFDEMLRAEFGARGLLEDDWAARVRLDGPTGVRLRSAAVQTFALAIHELTTNAVKYGAFSAPGGRLAVSWRTSREDSGEIRLHVEWLESGVPDMPLPGAPPRGGGTGRQLIEGALPYQLRAETTYEHRADGVRCTIDLPLG